ncbi:MFS transporter [Bosea robiniae]|uniref:Predicted arabinose efflux permease, MFS family n=1 Tax=Bosea robiniae TaxID=1036780 RepID=A0ABY0NDQ4_9HYPH|nr:MFS transporter [Bosea robiniae]SDF31698.1 Predicted arabinose efflux permease, MFS family [Bosea robiniae]
MESIVTTRESPIWVDSRAIALLMAASLTTMANATISPALPGIERLFADDPNAALLTRLLVPAPSLSVALFAPLAGFAADRIGRRAMLLVGVVLFVIAGSAGLVLPDLPSIFASRLVLGVAVALIMTAQTALIGDYFTGDDRNALTGLQISARNFGGLVFISLAGWAATLSPRLPFAIYGLAAIFLPLMWLAIVEPPRVAAATGAMPASDHDGHPSWRGLLAGLVLLQGATNMIFFLMPTQISFFLEARGYESAVMTGTVLGLLMISGGCTALLYRHVRRASGAAGVFAIGYAAMALGFLLLSRTASLPGLFAAALLIGAGYALVSPSFVAMALDLAPRRSRGMAGGILTASIFIGQFCSPLVSTPLIAAHGYGELFRGTAWLLTIMALAALLARFGAIVRSKR